MIEIDTLMTTIRGEAVDKAIVGIQPQERIRKRLLNIASGKGQQDPQDPKIWFTSRQSLDTVLANEGHPVGRMLKNRGVT